VTDPGRAQAAALDSEAEGCRRLLAAAAAERRRLFDELLRLLAAAPPPAAAAAAAAAYLGETRWVPQAGQARQCAELAAAAQFLDDRLAMTGSESARLSEQAPPPSPARTPTRD
jgi:hypothetical protein